MQNSVLHINKLSIMKLIATYAIINFVSEVCRNQVYSLIFSQSSNSKESISKNVNLSKNLLDSVLKDHSSNKFYITEIVADATIFSALIFSAKLLHSDGLIRPFYSKALVISASSFLNHIVIKLSDAVFDKITDLLSQFGYEIKNTIIEHYINCTTHFIMAICLNKGLLQLINSNSGTYHIENKISQSIQSQDISIIANNIKVESNILFLAFYKFIDCLGYVIPILIFHNIPNSVLMKPLFATTFTSSRLFLESSTNLLQFIEKQYELPIKSNQIGEKLIQNMVNCLVKNGKISEAKSSFIKNCHKQFIKLFGCNAYHNEKIIINDKFNSASCNKHYSDKAKLSSFIEKIENLLEIDYLPSRDDQFVKSGNTKIDSLYSYDYSCYSIIDLCEHILEFEHL